MSPSKKCNKKPSKLAQKYEAALLHLSPIAKPLASRRETRHIYKLVKKALPNESECKKVVFSVSGKTQTCRSGEGEASRHTSIVRGIKEVSKSLKKGSTGICVLAGDIHPIDVIAHLPILCEEKKISYIYVPSKEDLGIVSYSRRPTSCIFVYEPKKGSSYESIYERVKEDIQAVWSYTKF